MNRPNINYIIDLAEGDLAFQKKVISVIKKEFPIEINNFHENSFNKNYKLMSENVHKLKHKISMFGMLESYDLANKFEEELKLGLNTKQKDFERILDKISVFLNKI